MQKSRIQGIGFNSFFFSILLSQLNVLRRSALLAGFLIPTQERSSPHVLSAQVQLGQTAAGFGAVGQGGIGFMGAAGSPRRVQIRKRPLLRILELGNARYVGRRNRRREEHTGSPTSRRST